MQLNAFPSATSTVKFNDVVPSETSTRHVASAAFYHCLGETIPCALLTGNQG